jgi:pimeloyl-ACP methyl ester carboxylesterase
MKKTLIIFTLPFLFLISCENEEIKTSYTESKINLITHELTTYTIIKGTKYLVVFETGLGNDHSVWVKEKIPSQLLSKTDVLLYDRAGYGKSEKGPAPRDIDKLRSELESVISAFSNEKKVILVGHSLGGMIIRDYAIKNPSKTAAILFVDPSHEFYNQPTQVEEDSAYSFFSANYGVTYGGTMEARELIEDSQYMDGLPILPNIPIIVLTSMKEDPYNTTADKQNWFDAHELLKNGVTDFTHIATTQSGHYIMLEEPSLIVDNLMILLNKLP